MNSSTQDEEIDRILKSFRGDIIQSINMYGENIYNAQDHAQSQAKAALHRLMLKERLDELKSALNKGYFIPEMESQAEDRIAQLDS